MSIVKDAILVELRERVVKSQEYDALCTTAKTKTKREFYKKKLRENNIVVADLIVALERINKQEGETSNGPADNAEGHSEITSAE